jgi:hypothetical protein
MFLIWRFKAWRVLRMFSFKKSNTSDNLKQYELFEKIIQIIFFLQTNI